MRHIFSDLITEAVRQDDRIVLIIGDFGYGLFGSIPERQLLNIGICEQSMISMAAGMALEGLKPWVYHITPFLIERPFEQMKLDIDQQKSNVKLVGYADYPEQGCTHAELDAPYLMALFKSIRSYFPKDKGQVKAFFEEMRDIDGPAFMSLKKGAIG